MNELMNSVTVESLAKALNELLNDAPAASGFKKQISRIADVNRDDLSLMPGRGLAHDHWIINGTDLLLRVPKQSQMGLSAEENLFYQQCCFERMQPSGHTPVCFASIKPAAELPMGALLVQRIYGRDLQSEKDFDLIAQALAAIHSLPVLASNNRAPLLNQQNSLQSTLAEIETQAVFLSQAHIDADSLSVIEAELVIARSEVARLAAPPVCLISFDAHPGNYIIDANDRAVLVDLEKGRYGGCGFDLAHASLYTSTTWDISINIELSQQALQSFYATWNGHVPETMAEAMSNYLIPMRRLMWLWSVTWCAMWQVESKVSALQQKDQRDNTRDWAAENNPDTLIAHVRERVHHYLQPEVISGICEDFY